MQGFGVYYRDADMPEQTWVHLETFETMDEGYKYINELVREDIAEDDFNLFVYTLVPMDDNEKEI